MSMIQFSCPSCNAQYKVPAKAAGRQATCKSCGASMTVPTESEGTGGGSAGNVDLSGLYNSAEATAAAPVAAAFDGGSVFATPPRRSGPSPVLLAGIGGGVLLLILAVVLIVVLMGGGDDPGPNPNPGPVAGAGGGDGDRGRRRDRGTSRVTTTDNDPDDNGDETNGGTGEPVATTGRVIMPPTATLGGVEDWTLPVPDAIASFADKANFRGMVITLPPEWQTETRVTDTMVRGNDSLRDDLTETFNSEVLETAFLRARPRESLVEVEFGVIVSRAPIHDEWPEITEVDRITSSLGLDNDGLEDLRAVSGTNSAAPALTDPVKYMLDSPEASPLGFNAIKPGAFFLKAGSFDRVQFGTLFGGHPFARVVLRNESEGTRVLLYTGYVEHMQVTFIAEAPSRYPELIADMDWVVRSARLMSNIEARNYARQDPIFQQWMNDTFVDIAYDGDTAPIAGQPEAAWDGFTDRSLYQRTSLAATVTPYRQPYGIIPPEGMELASTNRVAVRWFPNRHGLWLQLKVTKLEGRAQRTLRSPILPAEGGQGERLFANSTELPLPAGYEHSEVEAGDFTLHRVLMPVPAGQTMQRVYYVMFDGGEQVTIEGRYDTARPADLQKLDAAARTLTKI